ncbi:hypothetical protein DFA_06525 [Cavenderia fasciculata]|uniref:Transmembrane protein n=1 Tax=Cavenderia fasciculata TaxID=261658 RepID=F4PJ89_CACFS|nr:uncharacterized protein DFA_06525 [Cavenderia fasciculata]EGG24375.1 hypothetical protein DFA_06525 [Cavenderia fasciculata]|eukprot:XP_004362226.1 hypothetical protein DFA_06525 [Cavenderia fasciculata]
MYTIKSFVSTLILLLVMIVVVFCNGGAQQPTFLAIETDYKDIHCQTKGIPNTMPTGTCISDSMYKCDMDAQTLAIFYFNGTASGCAGDFHVDVYNFGQCYGGSIYSCKQKK